MGIMASKAQPRAKFGAGQRLRLTNNIYTRVEKVQYWIYSYVIVLHLLLIFANFKVQEKLWRIIFLLEVHSVKLDLCLLKTAIIFKGRWCCHNEDMHYHQDR